MNLKYKKIILLTTMSVMGIGLLTLSVDNNNSKTQDKNETVKEALADVQTDITPEATVTAFVTPTVTVAPTPTPMPIYDIEKNAYPEVNKLFKNFYKAKTDRDVDAIKKLLSDPTKVDTQDDLQKKTEYIEEYTNINTYTKKGFEDGTYIVYVYHEIKFTGIATPAPGLSKFYVITDAQGKLKIFSGELDENTKAYYDERNNDKDVVAIIDMTNKKSKEAVKKDEDLQTFWNSINKLADKEKSKAKNDTAE